MNTVHSIKPLSIAEALERMPERDLRRHIALAAGILAHRTGGGMADQVLNRIGARLAGRPLS